MKLNRYDSGIKIYYSDDNYLDIAQEVIKKVYSKEQTNTRIELIKNKPERGVSVYLLEYLGNEYFVKNFKYNSLLRRLDNLIRTPYGIKQYRKANKLLEHDIPVINPIFALEKKESIFQILSTFVTEKSSGESLKQIYIKEDLNLEKRILIIKELGSLWAKLYNKNFMHLDPTPDNFLLDITCKKVKMRLVDLVDIYSLPIMPRIILIHNTASLFRHLVSKFYKHTSSGLTSEEWHGFFDHFNVNYKKDLTGNDFKNKIEKLVLKKLLQKKKYQAVKQDAVLNKRFKKREI